MKNEIRRYYKVLSLGGGLLVLLVLILYTGAFFRSRLIQPESVKTEDTPPEQTAYSTVEDIPEWYEAVGTVRSRTETQVSAQITGRILKVMVRPGDSVKKGDPLIYLDNQELQARLDRARQGVSAATARKEQARHALIAAQAVLVQAEADYKRTKTYFDQEAATKKDLEQAESSYKQAKAQVEQAKKGMAAAEAGVQQAGKVVEEAGIALGYATITATEAGEAAKRLAEPGDLAWPGKPLLVLQAPGALRLDAHVREGLIRTVLSESHLQVSINALDEVLDGRVEEVIPSADPLSRTFMVKVAIPSVQGLYPGMFGRLLVPLGRRQAVVVPEKAIHYIGQLELVKVEKDGLWYDCLVKTGKKINGKIEVLSGLNGDEKIAVRD